jgi:hypothetical protein
MEANLQAARLLAWQSVCTLDKKPRNRETVMNHPWGMREPGGRKESGGKETYVCKGCVALLGFLGYSMELLVGK